MLCKELNQLLIAGTVENNLKGTIERFVADDNAFSFMIWVKVTPVYWKVFMGAQAIIKQLGIPTYFSTLSCADLASSCGYTYSIKLK